MTGPLESDDLRALLDLEVEHVVRRLQGRETFLHRTADGRAIVVKRSEPGARPGGRREHDALERLASAGFDVPGALGFAQGPSGSIVVMENVPHRETVRDALQTSAADARRELLTRCAQLLARLHSSGFRHRDFYAHHLLVREPDGVLVLIDVGRAGRAPMPRRRWFVKDVGALLSSLPREVSRRERLRCVSIYLDARDIHGPRARRSFARAAFAKAARIASRIPRDERATAGAT